MQLINDVLDLSKIEAGVLDLYYSEFALNGVLMTLKGVVESRLQSSVELILSLECQIIMLFVQRKQTSATGFEFPDQCL